MKVLTLELIVVAYSFHEPFNYSDMTWRISNKFILWIFEWVISTFLESILWISNTKRVCINNFLSPWYRIHNWVQKQQVRQTAWQSLLNLTTLTWSLEVLESKISFETFYKYLPFSFSLSIYSFILIVLTLWKGFVIIEETHLELWIPRGTVSE